MLVALFIKGYRFFFYSDEGNEPMHIHIEKGGARGKVWLEPNIENEYLYDFTVREEREIRKLISENIVTLKNKWNEHFGE